MPTSVERVYFETSAFNHFLESLDRDSMLGTRDLQRQRGRELYISPVTVWELLLARNLNADHLLYAAQNFFSPNMLATPSELLIRYLRSAYPRNEINYDIFTDHEMGRIWESMTQDDSVTLRCDQSALIEKTTLLRQISNNLRSIINYPQTRPPDDHLENIASILQTTFECLERDGFLSVWSSPRYDPRILAKLYSLWMLGIFLWRFDFDHTDVDAFWQQEGIADEDLPTRVVHIMERYQELMRTGPILQMTLMSYHQLASGRRNRGLLLDSMHCVYAPYVHTILTADQDFLTLANQEPHFARKVRHVNDINLRTVPYLAP